MRRALLALSTLALSSVLGSGCAAEPHDAPVTYTNSQAIQGGVTDNGDPNVVGVYNQQQGALCTGSLILPNLVLTARHCVSAINTGEQVICGQSKFGTPWAASGFSVTTKTSIQSIPDGYASAVFVPPDSNDACGTDLALIQLKSNIPDTKATPLEPRVDSAVEKGETYRAVGFGLASESQQNSAGTKRVREGLVTKCVKGCQNYGATSKEFIGDTGICQGDSGGPALDTQNRVIGVVSRGGPQCSSPIYGSVYAWANWIGTIAQQAAAAGGYEPPAWVNGGPTMGTGAGGAAGSDPGTGGSGTAGTDPGTGGTGTAGDGSAGTDPGTSGSSGTGTGSGGPVGSGCTGPADCASGVCIKDKGQQYCSESCQSDDQCPTSFGYKCTNSVCTDSNLKAESSDSGSCSITRDPVKPVPWKSGALALAGLAFVGAMRRRARKA